jgi:hypothetical protein
MPEAAFFVCQQQAPQHFWKPDYQRHANGALAISEVVMRAEDPASLAELFGKMQGKDAVSTSAGQLVVNTACGRVVVLDPRRATERFGDALPRGPRSPHFIAYRITVADIGKAKALLDKAGVASREQGGALQIAAKDAFGTVIEFAAA